VPIATEQLEGHRLVGVATSWHEHQGHRADYPLHVWLQIADLGSVQARCAGEGSLELRLADPYGAYEMPELDSKVVVETTSSGSPLISFIGQRIERVGVLRQVRTAVGIVLEFRLGSIGLANIGDDLVALPSAASEWNEWSVEGI